MARAELKINRGRLEAFSDGVLAIIITIMVLELKVPRGDTLAAIRPLMPAFLSYLLSFVYVGIYWNNHHHLLQLCSNVTGAVMWANLHLLFWLSLFPFAAGWMGQNHFAPVPSAFYGCILFMAAIAYWLLQRAIIAAEGQSSLLRRAVGRDWKGLLSPLVYVLAIVFTRIAPWLAQALYVLIALVWLRPDPRIERVLRATRIDGSEAEQRAT